MIACVIGNRRHQRIYDNEAPLIFLWTEASLKSIWLYHFYALQWRHNGRDSVSNHQPHDCLLNRSFRRRSKKTSKLRITGLCAGNSPGTGEFPSQMASYAENVSIWWRHHDLALCAEICHRSSIDSFLINIYRRRWYKENRLMGAMLHILVVVANFRARTSIQKPSFRV